MGGGEARRRVLYHEQPRGHVVTQSTRVGVGQAPQIRPPSSPTAFPAMVDPRKFEVFLRMYSTRLANFERRAERQRLRAETDDRVERVRNHVRRVRRRFDRERDFLVEMATAGDA